MTDNDNIDLTKLLGPKNHDIRIVKTKFHRGLIIQDVSEFSIVEVGKFTDIKYVYNGKINLYRCITDEIKEIFIDEV